MPLAIAIVVVMVLHLIDKHNQWAKARKFGIWSASVVAAAAVLFWGGSWAYAKYTDWQLERYTTRHYQMKHDMISKFRGKTVFPNICKESDFNSLMMNGAKSSVQSSILICRLD
jgi:4-amino-4-deoxy-L-arabinose transferase-like glycosyltransferase